MADILVVNFRKPVQKYSSHPIIDYSLFTLVCVFQEYIKAVFEPETTQVINADIYGCLNLADEIEEIERTSGACINHLQEELYEIRGSEMATTLAYSKLEQAIRVFQNNNKFVMEKRSPETMEEFSNELQSYDLKRSDVKEDLREVENLNYVNQSYSTVADNDKEPIWILRDSHCAKGREKTHGRLRVTQNQSSDSVIDHTHSKEPIVSENQENEEDIRELNDQNSGCENLEEGENALESQSRENGETDSEPTVTRVRDFAAKLGYKESEISSAMEKLGPEADKNAILLELVNAQASMKQLEEGPSGSNFKSVIPTVLPDPECLRPIVIDGSNVAMR